MSVSSDGPVRLQKGTPAPGVPALEFDKVCITYRVKGRDATVLDGLSLRVERGESYGLVGESGCGKSTAALAVLRYLSRGGRVSSGTIRVAGQDISELDEAGLRAFRANVVSMVFQDPIAALNPTLDRGHPAGGGVPAARRRPCGRQAVEPRCAEPGFASPTRRA